MKESIPNPVSLARPRRGENDLGTVATIARRDVVSVVVGQIGDLAAVPIHPSDVRMPAQAIADGEGEVLAVVARRRLRGAIFELGIGSVVRPSWVDEKTIRAGPT
jgi:hypothetical protein